MYRNNSPISTIRKFVTSRWSKINTRTINGLYPDYNCPKAANYFANGIMVLCNKVEFELWCLSQAQHILNLINSGETPSIDRIDSTGHYSLENMRIISMTEQRKKTLAENNYYRHKIKPNRVKIELKKCQYCNKYMQVKKYKDNRMESRTTYTKRKFCNRSCATSFKNQAKMFS